ncbi:putative hydroxymethylpyrimidine transporter CytX [Clostridium sp. Ade.TY]|uniref:putative hydroxymethylpyrimidine transporter CytX n=1 Tax=Clostridium sp. Ade.TY TaxID=1391647 RepID=UPI00042819FD|nr:putative hydroxymethylpyrimidine transporter CytX [Clostridium sp. Ade.TY]
MNNKKLGFFTLAFLWFGAAISIAEILTGGLLAPIGFLKGLEVIIVGHLIGTTILVLGGFIGFKEGVPSITSTRISFGKYGTYLFSILNVLQLIGWTAVMIRAAATSVQLITKSIWGFDNLFLCIILIGILTGVWIWFGRDGMKNLNIIAVSLLFILTLVLGFIIFKDGLVFKKSFDGAISIGQALELNIVMPLSWLPLIADYTRFAKNGKSAVFGSFIGYFLGSSWMFVIGLGASIVSNSSDPSYIMLAANLGIMALGIVVLSTVTTTFLDVYSAGISFLNIMPKLNERKIGIIMTIIGTIVALIVQMENYENFLYAIGSVFAPLFAILISDYFVLKKRLRKDVLINIESIIVWVIGIIIYYIFVKLDFIVGSTLPAMIITGFINILFSGRVFKWRILEK